MTRTLILKTVIGEDILIANTRIEALKSVKVNKTRNGTAIYLINRKDPFIVNETFRNIIDTLAKIT